MREVLLSLLWVVLILLLIVRIAAGGGPWLLVSLWVQYEEG